MRYIWFNKFKNTPFFLRHFKNIYSIVICLFLFSANGQILPPGQYTSVNKKAIKQLEEGKAAFETKNDLRAKEHF